MGRLFEVDSMEKLAEVVLKEKPAGVEFSLLLEV